MKRYNPDTAYIAGRFAFSSDTIGWRTHFFVSPCWAS